MRARVLLIDDSRFLRSALEKTLIAKGFEVQVAGDGEEGLRLAREDGKFDLILLDLFLPKMTGHEVLRLLKEDPATAAIPVLVLSGLAKEKERQELMNSGAVDCLVKAQDLMAVVASAERCLKLE
ncbi:MAG TPA: response regulator [Terriglobales bacterium]|jgi:CheY-like chemotaxis protein|nr:response regulator [Terriglobales bacterium]